MRNWANFIRERLAAEGKVPERHRDAIDELAAHLGDVEREARAAGADAAAAARAAEAELDGLGPLSAALAARGSRSRRAPLWRGLGDDLRQAVRALLRRRGFSAAVFATLALGIGVNTATFAFVNALLVRELPYRDPSRLAFMWSKLAWVGVPRAWVAGPHIPKLLHEAQTIEDIAAIRTKTDHLTGSGTPQLIRSGVTSSNLFDVLGVRPMLGRGFVKADEPLNVTVISYPLWQRVFGGDPSVVGRKVEISGEQMEVIGVLPESFRFLVHSSLGDPLAADLWMPTNWGLEKRPDSSFAFAALVRVKPTSTLAAAQAELDRIGKDLDRTRFKSKGFGWQLIGVREDLVKSSRATVLLVAAGAGFLLIVICANIAGLVLVRNSDRRREFAVRAALGAGRWQLARLVTAECVLLSVAAGAAGGVLAWLGVRAVVASGAIALPRLAEVNIDWRVVLFTTAISVVAGGVFGLVPALRLRGDHAALKDATRGSSAETPWLRGALVAGELAVAAMLIAGSVLLLRSYSAIRHVDPGFDGRGVLTARLTLDGSRYPDGKAASAVQALYAERLAAIPGVVASGATSSRPLDGDTDQSMARPLDGTRPQGDAGSIMTDIMRTTPGYFRAMGVRLVAGRDFTSADREGAEAVAIVDESFARHAWPDGAAVGKRISLDGGAPTTIVGVVRHARQYRIDRDDREQVYRPYAQDPVESVYVTLRTPGDPLALTSALRAAVAGVDAKQPLADVQSMPAVVDAALAGRRLQLSVLGAFAAGAILLAALGIYSVLASVVASRTREIGIRLALGASGAGVQSLVLRDVFVLAGAGAAIGLAAALAAARLIGHLLFGVSAHDPESFAITAALLLAAACAAAYPPARRAARVDPSVSLRGEN